MEKILEKLLHLYKSPGRYYDLLERSQCPVALKTVNTVH